MKHLIGCVGIILGVMFITPANASQPTDTLAFALGAHSGEIRLLESQDMKRHITASRTQTWHIQATTEGPTFEVSFADIDQGSGIGFDQPGVGTQRVNTVLAVMEYISGLFPMHSGTARIHFEPSITDPDFLFAGQAYPFYPGYPCNPGYQNPLVYNAIVNDQHLGDIDASIVLNFNGLFNWNSDYNRSPMNQELDLYSLVLHEMGHALGFLGFAFDESGSRIFCDGQAAFPNFTKAIRDEAGDPLWVLINGVPTFAGEPRDLSATTFSSLALSGLDPSETQLHKNRFIFEGEGLRSFSGHWHPAVNVLMASGKPSRGVRTNGFSPVTISLLNEVIGFGGLEAESLLGLTGSWFDPASDGRGFNIQFIDEDHFIIYFYGFLDNSERFWLIGSYSGEVSYNTFLEISMLEATGGVYNNYNPGNVDVTPWGTLTITFIDCNTAIATLTGPEGEINFNLTKLAGVEGLSC